MARKHILHISRGFYGDEPTKAAHLLDKHSNEYVGIHLSWAEGNTEGKVLSDSSNSMKWIDWADIIHLHGRGCLPTDDRKNEILKKKCVLQSYERIADRDMLLVLEKKCPLIIHPNSEYIDESYDNLFLVPNPIVNEDLEYPKKPLRKIPITSVSVERSNHGYSHIHRALITLRKNRVTMPQFIDRRSSISTQKILRKSADIAIDNVVPCVYRSPSLEYLSASIPCVANLRGAILKRFESLFGTKTLPFTHVNKENALGIIRGIAENNSWQEKGELARDWMLAHWSPEKTVAHYEEIYSSII